MFEIKVTIDTSPVLTKFLQSITDMLSSAALVKNNEVKEETGDTDHLKTEKEEVKSSKVNTSTEEMMSKSETIEEAELTQDQESEFVQLRKIAAQKMKAGKSKELQQILTSLGVAKLPEVKPKDYEKLRAKLEAV